MPGALATAYATEMGGRVEWVGKPAKIVFDYAQSMGSKEQQHQQRGSTLMIGDSLMHDVKGRSRREANQVELCMHYSESRYTVLSRGREPDRSDPFSPLSSSFRCPRARLRVALH